MNIYKLIFSIVSLFILAKIFSVTASYYIHATTPIIIENTENQAKNSKNILHVIGEYRGFETHYNKYEFDDSIANFSVKIIGNNKSALLKLKAYKSLSGQWNIIKADTVYID